MKASAPRRMPSLDGLRAVGILLVLFAHLRGTTGFPVVPSEIAPIYGGIADMGVRLFFVLSGFLITQLLKQEIAETGSISLRWFYFRRTLRIFPAYYTYLLFLLLACALGVWSMSVMDFVSAATYTTNYHHHRSWYAGHSWSLAVEEQFYLLWPLVLKLLAPRRARLAALGTMLVAPLVRVILLRYAPGFRLGIGESFVTVADTLATGCLLALMHEELGQSRRYLSFLKGPLFWLAPLAALGTVLIPSSTVLVLFGETIMNVAFAITIDRFVRFPESPVGSFLNTRLMATLGTLSYSLYLWQQPFLNRFGRSVINHFPLSVGLALAAALLSYHLIEQPFLRLRSQLERRLRARHLSHHAPSSA